jgi:DNA polymerase-4
MKGAQPLRWLFLDLNSYFASVQQAEHPHLRDRPVAVVPMITDSTSVIAASYEAKAFGIRTGTNVGDALKMCPDLELVTGDHKVYTAYGARIKEVLEDVLPIDKVCSIDEMRFRLLGREMDRQAAEELALRMKKALHDHVSPWVKASIGIAPNSFLAKLATDMKKPDGLVIIEGEELPDRLKGLKLTEFCGINYRMEARLKAAGIFISDDMIKCSAEELRKAFQCVTGERWWFLLRGWDLPDIPTQTRSLGHSHVLAPELRNDQDARDVLIRLAHKAVARLRQDDLFATEMSVSIRGKYRSWRSSMKLSGVQDTPTITSCVLDMWESRTFDIPSQAAVTFTGLRRREEVTLNLFDQTLEKAEMSRAVDKMNKRYGKNQVHLASIHEVRDTAEERIAFNKTWLFSEGKEEAFVPQNPLVPPLAAP